MSHYETPPFEPECYFCFDRETEEPEPVFHVTFVAGHEGFICEEHFTQMQQIDVQSAKPIIIAEQRLVQTGIDRVMRQYGE